MGQWRRQCAGQCRPARAGARPPWLAVPARPSAAQERALGAVYPWDKAQHRPAEGQIGHSFTGGGTSSCRRAKGEEDRLVEHRSRVLMGCKKHKNSKPKNAAKRTNVAVVAEQLVQHNHRSS